MSERNEMMGADLLLAGTVMQEDGSYFQGRDGFYIVHPDDLLHVKLTADSARLNGCCGLDGCDGPNLHCETCGTYVATKMTDCWMAHCVVFEPDTTRLVAEPGN
jgi:hypothetical protein